MLSGINAAVYLLKKDTDKKLFNKKVINKCDRGFYEGNARLNKYLHLAQNIYIAKTGKPLIDIEFYAYDNGAVSPYIQENYAVLLGYSKNAVVKISSEEKDFLDKIYIAFQSADIDELIQLSHEDSEWVDNNHYYQKKDQKMDSMKHADEYKEQYKDFIKILDRMQ